MKAKFKSGKVISGRLAETFSRIGITTTIDESEIEAKTPKAKKAPVKRKAKTPKVEENEKID